MNEFWSCCWMLMSIFCVFIQVLKISLIGHRKRILASLGDRLHDDTPQKPPRAISLRVSESQTVCVVWTVNTLCNMDYKLLWIIRQRKKAPVSSQMAVYFSEGATASSLLLLPSNDYPNLSGRHKMAVPLQFPPCQLALDTNRKGAGFASPVGATLLMSS